ncbi:hypothetical protein CERZMDRAFT_85365 [Cercospora zeae-maydis SCOH1-5]|uniref:Uncharacterized protein n=1 Tax=Cercospora zeae-maydis SCOH1-5 TaxID=717836 RepID=A0A6A6FDY4_9PEZI|nr:hypothetical protein CERZMDRAFT_85365 [Cercospora zeae-maydis SCOH1-5]
MTAADHDRRGNVQVYITSATLPTHPAGAMAHRICCPSRRSEELSELPCRAPLALDGTLVFAFLPEDHPHGRRFHLSPVDMGILKSPRIADKFRLKMSKKSSKTLRKELDRLAEPPYNEDAHILTSTEVLEITEPGPTGIDGTRDINHNNEHAPFQTTPRFGSLDLTTGEHTGRNIVSSPSIYSRSQSRVDEVTEQAIATPTPRNVASPADAHGVSYRSILPRQPSMTTLSCPRSHPRQLSKMQPPQLTGKHSHHFSVHSRTWSGSTESTIRRRLEQSALDCPPDSPATVEKGWLSPCSKHKLGTKVHGWESVHKERV